MYVIEFSLPVIVSLHSLAKTFCYFYALACDICTMYIFSFSYCICESDEVLGRIAKSRLIHYEIDFTEKMMAKQILHLSFR